MLDAAPGEIGDVQQAVDAAEVDERAVVGDVLDDALDGAPSCSEASRCSRSAPAVSSSTARRDTTTLLRLRSSLMTLNSISLPSYGVVSFTGRRSTSDPGRKARMPLAITVRPPFTLPVMTPLIFSPLSSAFSRPIQAAMRFALSRDRRVEP
jgi:hypothetical protein